MKTNYRIINFLRILFKVFYKLSIISFVLLGIGHLIHLFVPINVPEIPFVGTAKLKIDTAYDLLLGGHFNDNIEIGLELGRIQSNDLLYRIIALLNLTTSSLISIFLFKNAWQIFEELHNRKENGSYFSINIYSRIKNVGFLMLVYPIYFFMNGAIISWLLLDNVSFMGQEVHFHPDYTLLTKIISVLVIFVFAEIYRAGIEIKEESAYTI